MAAKKQLGEEIEKIVEMGDENEDKAAKVVIEEGKEQKKKDDDFENKKLEQLEHKTKFQFKEYKKSLADSISEIIVNKDVCEPGWHWGSWVSDEGVGLTVINPDGKKFYRAFRPINNPKFDLNACVTLALQFENLIGKYNEAKNPKLKGKTESGIILPN